MLQNVYQMRRSYVRHALGKARAVDIAASETLVEKPTDLVVLVVRSLLVECLLRTTNRAINNATTNAKHVCTSIAPCSVTPPDAYICVFLARRLRGMQHLLPV
jgi:hypothetical protein